MKHIKRNITAISVKKLYLVVIGVVIALLCLVTLEADGQVWHKRVESGPHEIGLIKK